MVRTNDPETRALVAVLDALGPLDDEARQRVLRVAADFFDLPSFTTGAAATGPSAPGTDPPAARPEDHGGTRVREPEP